MKKIIMSGVVAVGLLASGIVAADNLKIGVVDVQQILQQSPQVATINASLNKQFKPRQDKVIAAQQSLQNEVDNLNKNGPTMTQDARNKLQDKIISDRANVQGMALSFQRDLQNAQNQGMQTFMNQLTAAVNKVAQAGSYNLVLQRAGVPYVGNGLDVTSQVMQAMGK